MLKIPKSHQKQELMAHVSKTSADDEVRARKQENLDSDCQLLDFRGQLFSFALMEKWIIMLDIRLSYILFVICNFFFCPCPFHSGSMGVRFDEHGMILPHTILGSLEDYRSYLEAKGETEVFFKCSSFCR